jgi:mono/diheme cytochrome c family protein
MAGLPGCLDSMWNGSKLKPLEPSVVFADARSSRSLVPDTVPRNGVVTAGPLDTGREGNKPVDTFPLPVTRELVDRGQQRFNIYCSPCHGRTGQGDGMVVQRGYRRPPSYHQDRLRDAPVGHFFDVMTNGFGAMPDYAAQIAVEDRWAIVAYIRALQLSEHATLADVPPADRSRIQ